MKILTNEQREQRNIAKHQMGGQVGAPAPEAAPAQGGDPLEQVVAMFSQGLQEGSCELLAQGAELFLQLVQAAQQPQQAPIGEEGAPVFRKGGVMKRVRKGCKK